MTGFEISASSCSSGRGIGVTSAGKAILLAGPKVLMAGGRVSASPVKTDLPSQSSARLSALRTLLIWLTPLTYNFGSWR